MVPHATCLAVTASYVIKFNLQWRLATCLVHFSICIFLSLFKYSNILIFFTGGGV
jgi:hypothetical protein